MGDEFSQLCKKGIQPDSASYSDGETDFTRRRREGNTYCVKVGKRGDREKRHETHQTECE